MPIAGAPHHDPARRNKWETNMTLDEVLFENIQYWFSTWILFATERLFLATMADGIGSEVSAPLLLSDDEKRILYLHDRLQQLQLEIALLTAQKNYDPSQ